MPTCFLSYHSAYAQLVPPFKNLLELLGFEVDVFDEPNRMRDPDQEMKARVARADSAVILYGPEDKPAGGEKTFEGAEWPSREAEIAVLNRKPLAVFLHNGTELPYLLQGGQTCAHFDFWDPWSFVTKSHHIVKHILDLRDEVSIHSSQPYYFRKVSYHNRISGDGEPTKVDLYHEVFAQQPCSRFAHMVDTCRDQTPEAVYGPLTQDRYKITATVGRDHHKILVEEQENTACTFKYTVKVEPPLAPKEVFAYSARFKVPNRFPLTYAELERRQEHPDYPRHIFPRGYYGDFFAVPGDTELVTLSIHFPLHVKLEDYTVQVMHSRSLEKNDTETKRCMQYLELREESEKPEKVLEINKLFKPLVNNSYYLLYKPGD